MRVHTLQSPSDYSIYEVLVTCLREAYGAELSLPPIAPAHKDSSDRPFAGAFPSNVSLLANITEYYNSRATHSWMDEWRLVRLVDRADACSQYKRVWFSYDMSSCLLAYIRASWLSVDVDQWTQLEREVMETLCAAQRRANSRVC